MMICRERPPSEHRRKTQDDLSAGCCLSCLLRGGCSHFLTDVFLCWIELLLWSSRVEMRRNETNFNCLRTSLPGRFLSARRLKPTARWGRSTGFFADRASPSSPPPLVVPLQTQANSGFLTITTYYWSSADARGLAKRLPSDSSCRCEHNYTFNLSPRILTNTHTHRQTEPDATQSQNVEPFNSLAKRVNGQVFDGNALEHSAQIKLICARVAFTCLGLSRDRNYMVVIYPLHEP